MVRSFAALLVLLIAVPALQAQDRPDLRRLILVNGDIYVGVVADESADPVTIRTTDGVERRFSQAEIERIAPLIRGRFFRTDPVKTRLFFAPTARTLGGGEFRGDLAYFYPSITAGVSDRVDMLATGFVTFGDGAFVTPLVGIKGQVYDGENAQVAIGTSALIALGGDGGFGAVPYIVATFGDETRSFSAGAGGFVGSVANDIDIANALVYGLGGETQINNGVKLFVEALGLIGFDSNEEVCVDDTYGRYCYQEDNIGEGLLILPGVRFFGDRFAFDVIGGIATDFESVYGFAPVGFRASYGF